MSNIDKKIKELITILEKEEWKKWKQGKQTANQTMINTNTKRTTFYKLSKKLEKVEQ